MGGEGAGVPPQGRFRAGSARGSAGRSIRGSACYSFFSHHHSTAVVGVRPRRLRLPSPRLALQSRCAGLVGPSMSPPRPTAMRWSRVKPRACRCGSVMSMGSPQSQQTARVGSFSSRRRSRLTRCFHAQLSLRTLVLPCLRARACPSCATVIARLGRCRWLACGGGCSIRGRRLPCGA